MAKTKASKRIKIGGGGYENLKTDSLSLDDARTRFLIAIKKIVPCVLIDLRNSCFETFQNTYYELLKEAHDLEVSHLDESQKKDIFQKENLWYWKRLSNAAQELQELKIFYEKITEWAKKWNLNVDWMKDRALHTLKYWNEKPEILKILHWHYPNSGVSQEIPDEEIAFKFEYINWQTLPSGQKQIIGLGWDYKFEDKKEAEVKIREAFEEYLREYFDKVEKQLLEFGLKQKQEKRSLIHFEWLVRFQVQICEYKDIAKQYSVSLKSVKNALKDIRNLIHLPTTPGRRSKKRQKPI